MIRPFATLALMLTALPALAQERIPSHCIALAAGPETVVPAALTVPEADHVLIRFLDHASFAIVAEDGTFAVTDYTGFIGATGAVPDVVTMNNSHRTHWTPTPDPAILHALKGWPEDGALPEYRLDLGMMLVRNVTTDARSWGGSVRPDGNSIFIFEVAGLCIGHLGHLHQIPTDAQYAAIGRMDIVLVPVDGRVTLAVDDMVQVVRRLRSKVVIPMHWMSGAGLDMFMADLSDQFQVVETGLNEMVFSIADLPAEPTILVLEPRWLD